jgi:hypothetical protein
MSSDFHEDYKAAPRPRRWISSLQALFMELTKRVKAQDPFTKEDLEADRWPVWFVLPGGAFVAMRRRDDLDGRKELRIARRAPADTPEKQGKWESEVSTFLKHFVITPLDGDTCARTMGKEWLRQELEELDEGKAAARFIELKWGESHPGKTLCMDCSEGIPWNASYGPRNRCLKCGIAAGREEARDLAEKRSGQAELGV